MTTAIQKAFAPKAKIPPSPNSKACIAKATLTAKQEVQGPNNIAISTAPTAWALVPPGAGRLNIMIRKDKEVPIPNIGIVFLSVSTLTFTSLTALYQIGNITAPIAAQVVGLR